MKFLSNQSEDMKNWLIALSLLVHVIFISIVTEDTISHLIDDLMSVTGTSNSLTISLPPPSPFATFTPAYSFLLPLIIFALQIHEWLYLKISTNASVTEHQNYP